MTAEIKWGHHVTACGRAGVAMDVEPSRVFVRFEDMSGAWFDRCGIVRDGLPVGTVVHDCESQ